MSERLALPFARGIAIQRYLPAEPGLLNCHGEGCTHWYIDLSGPADHLPTWSATRRSALLSAAADLGCTPILHGNFRAPLASEIPEIRQGVWRYLTRELALAAELRAPLIVHGGVAVEPRPSRGSRREALERALAMGERLQRKARSYEVELWFENLSHYPRHRPFSYVLTTPSDVEATLAAIPDARFMVDLGHAHVNQRASLIFLERFAASIGALSFSDNDGNSDAHLTLGSGDLPVGEVVAAIENARWSGIVAFETRNGSPRDGVAWLRAALTGARAATSASHPTVPRSRPAAAGVGES